METGDEFERAKQIAMIAASLDSDKNEFPDELRDLAEACVGNLHELAEKLAGDQAIQIYGWF